VQRELGEDPPLFKRHTIPHIWQHNDKRKWGFRSHELPSARRGNEFLIACASCAWVVRSAPGDWCVSADGNLKNAMFSVKRFALFVALAEACRPPMSLWPPGGCGHHHRESGGGSSFCMLGGRLAAT
jgi:hypothetical protein